MKPFQLHMITMPKNKGKRTMQKPDIINGGAQDSQKVSNQVKIENLQETCLDIKSYGKEKVLIHIINKLEEIQDKTDQLKKKMLSEDGGEEQSQSQQEEVKAQQ